MRIIIVEYLCQESAVVEVMNP